MPSRHLTTAIVLFWLATTGWMVYREVLPHWRAGEPPPFHLDLADEVSERHTLWHVYDQDTRVGSAYTRVRRRADKNYQLQVDFQFSNWQVLFLEVDKCSCGYVITPKGELRGLDVQMDFGPPLKLHGEISGRVEGNELHSVARFGQGDQAGALWELKLEPITLSAGGSVLNTMHPVNRIVGLYEGREWHVPVFDPVEVATASLPKTLQLSPLATTVLGPKTGRSLLATTRADALRLGEADVPCWRVDFQEPGKGAQSRVWARQADGLVLRMEAKQMGKTLRMEREL